MRQEIKNWWEQAEADLKTAKDNLMLKNYYASVMFSQQAAEKSLKALYVLRTGKFPPKTHDLIQFCQSFEAPLKIVFLAESLTGTYLSSRYPGVAEVIPAKFYDEEKAELHLEEAEEIIKWVSQMIQ